MKRTLKTTLMLAFGFGSLFMATPASAQYNLAHADVPFAFVVSGKTLPAGNYDISHLNSSSPLFSLRGDQGSVFALLGVRNQSDARHPSITFRRVGSQWVLIRIVPPASQTAYSLPESATRNNPHMKMATMVSVKLQ